MANYLRSGDARKKRELCARRASALALRIQSGVPKEELARAVEDVRYAHLQAIRGLLHELDPARTEDCTAELSGRIAKLQAEAEEWKRATVEEIITLHSQPLA